MPPQLLKSTPLKKKRRAQPCEASKRPTGRIRHRLIEGYKVPSKPKTNGERPRKWDVKTSTVSKNLPSKPSGEEAKPQPDTHESTSKSQTNGETAPASDEQPAKRPREEAKLQPETRKTSVQKHESNKRQVQNGIWNIMFAKLCAYKDEKGDCSVPQKYPENPKLATWVKNQRQLLKKNKMTVERQARLREIGFSFSINSERVTWDQMFERCKTQLDQFESHKYSYSYSNISIDRKLSRWIRAQYDRADGLSAERAKKLSSIQFWSRATSLR